MLRSERMNFGFANFIDLIFLINWETNGGEEAGSSLVATPVLRALARDFGASG